NLCLNKGRCISLKDTFKCECLTGYSGKTCKIKDACLSSPCLNNGTCSGSVTSFTCICVKGFTGVTC
ncbi:hypothetical protein HELRODRAFT_137482, partial [Helobdella robusta]|uniref:EGF-like domain-containing protein n=1 Tax=Helobdella robusta TaxID=6412 RepID=T1EIL0_HELRO